MKNNPRAVSPSGIAVICTLTNELDVLSLGDDAAHSLGLRVARMRNIIGT